MAKADSINSITIPREGLLRSHHMCILLGIGNTTLWKRIKAGIIPEPTKFGPRLNVWHAEDVYAFLENIGKGERDAD